MYYCTDSYFIYFTEFLNTLDCTTVPISFSTTATTTGTSVHTSNTRLSASGSQEDLAPPISLNGTVETSRNATEVPNLGKGDYVDFCINIRTCPSLLEILAVYASIQKT